MEETFVDTNMIDVTEKEESVRLAFASGKIKLSQKVLNLILDNKIEKGNVWETARIAAIMAVKRTPEIIPLCHPLRITSVNVEFFVESEESSVKVEVSVKAKDRTGVEMEALHGVTAALLTIYDMVKMYEKDMELYDIFLLRKTGGKSGEYLRQKF